jgi:prepilin-type N-terminal cleavage/methylation domain-containing protein
MSINNKRGFTLLEMLIAIGLFTISIFICFGALVGLFDSNKKSQTIFSAMTNLNYSIESMIRDIRFSQVYHCDTMAGTVTTARDCGVPGAASFAATLPNGNYFTYTLSGGQIMKSVNGGSSLPVTGTDVTITNLKFYVAGSAPASSGSAGSNVQPYVVVVIKGYSGSKPSSQTNFDIETLVSQQQIDL